MIAGNVLIEWLDEKDPERVVRIERILAVYPDAENHEDLICVINRDSSCKTAKPRIETLKKYKEAIAAGEARLSLQDDVPSKNYPSDFRPQDGETAEERAKRQKDYADRDARYAAIEPLVEDIFRYAEPRERGRMLREVSAATGHARKTLEKWCRWYFQEGMQKNALMSHYKGNSGAPNKRRQSSQKLGRRRRRTTADEHATGVNVTDADRSNFDEAIKYYETTRKNGKTNSQGEPLSLYDAFTEMLQTHYWTHEEDKYGVPVRQVLPSHLRPSFDQFKAYYYKEYVQKQGAFEKSDKRRYGSTNYSLTRRGLTGDTTRNAYGSGSQFQIDATIADVYLVSALDPQRIIGRPVIYLTSDTFSHMIMAFSVTLEGPSWLGATSVLGRLAKSRVQIYTELGIPISELDFPDSTIGFPNSLVADNGELASRNGLNLLHFLGVKSLILLPPFRPDWKGLVENKFKLINDDVISWMPGHVYNAGERGGDDYRLDARYTLKTFEKLMAFFVLQHNCAILKNYRADQFMITNDLLPYTPLKLWNYGLDRTGGLKKYDYEFVRKALLPREKAMVTPSGIRYKGMFFESPTFWQSGWASRARTRGRWPVTLAVDPRDPSCVFLCDDDGQILEPCTVGTRSQTFNKFNWYEIRDHQFITGILEDEDEDRQVQGEIDLAAVRRDVLDEVPAPDRSHISRAEATGNIRQNRQEERNFERAKGALQPGEPPEPQPQQSTPEDRAKNKAIDKMRKQRQRSKNNEN